METQMQNGKVAGAHVHIKAAADAFNASVAARPSLKYGLRTIDKDEARRLLGTTLEQRPYDPVHAAGYSRTMDFGLWDTAAGRVPIGITGEGRVINGQHRLRAFLDSKLTEITFLFVTNCTKEDIRTFDVDGKRRGYKQIVPDLTAPGRDFARVKGLEKILSGNKNVKDTQTVLRHLVTKVYRKQCEWAEGAIANAGGYGKAAYVAALMYVHRSDAEFADAFAKTWASGDGLDPSARRMRDDALRGQGGGAAVGTRTMLRMLNILAYLHQKKAVPTRLSDSLAGLKYWSGLRGDGAARKWESGGNLLPSEEG
jgi:hypothetical protein